MITYLSSTQTAHQMRAIQTRKPQYLVFSANATVRAGLMSAPTRIGEAGRDEAFSIVVADEG